MPSIVGCLIAIAVISGCTAYDPGPLQDLCVASYSGPKVNGFVCKSDANVTADDFSSDLLAKPLPKFDNTGFSAVMVDVNNMPGLNTLGMSIAKAEFAPGGMVQLHTHPRATELIYVMEGEMVVGFITTGNKYLYKSVKKGQVFVIPQGLIHFQKNYGEKPASLLVTFNSQNPGVQSVPPSLFAANPAVQDDVLAEAFQVDTKIVKLIKSNLAPKKS